MSKKYVYNYHIRYNYGRKENDSVCAQQPSPHSPTGDIAEVNRQNSKGMCQGGKPVTGKLYTHVCLSGCMVDGLEAMAAHSLV